MITAVYARGMPLFNNKFENLPFGCSQGNGLPWGSFHEELDCFYDTLENLAKLGNNRGILIGVSTFESLPTVVWEYIAKAYNPKKVFVCTAKAEVNIGNKMIKDLEIVSKIGQPLRKYLNDNNDHTLVLGGAGVLRSCYKLDILDNAYVSNIYNLTGEAFAHDVTLCNSLSIYPDMCKITTRSGTNAGKTLYFKQELELYK